jgi:hypothetical protein
LRIASIAIAVLPGLAVADDQFALAASDRRHRVDRLDAGLQRLVHRLAVGTPVAMISTGPLLGGLNGAFAVERIAQRIEHAADHGVAGGTDSSARGL